ncbi:hypothetical protein PTKIN_Ptkin06aG0197000 [Pterospermum kingtungense]
MSQILSENEYDNENFDNTDLPPDLTRLIELEEKQIMLYEEEVETINVGTEENRKELKIGTILTTKIRKEEL